MFNKVILTSEMSYKIHCHQNHTILTHSTAIGGPSWTPLQGSRMPRSKSPHSRCSHRTSPILSQHWWQQPHFGAFVFFLSALQLHSSTICDAIMCTTPASYLMSSPQSFTTSIPYPSHHIWSESSCLIRVIMFDVIRVLPEASRIRALWRQEPFCPTPYWRPPYQKIITIIISWWDGHKCRKKKLYGDKC